MLNLILKVENSTPIMERCCRCGALFPGEPGLCFMCEKTGPITAEEAREALKYELALFRRRSDRFEKAFVSEFSEPSCMASALKEHFSKGKH